MWNTLTRIFNNIWSNLKLLTLDWSFRSFKNHQNKIEISPHPILIKSQLRRYFVYTECLFDIAQKKHIVRKWTYEKWKVWILNLFIKCGGTILKNGRNIIKIIFYYYDELLSGELFSFTSVSKESSTLYIIRDFFKSLKKNHFENLQANLNFGLKTLA